MRTRGWKTDRKALKQTKWQTNWLTKRQTNRQTDTHKQTDRQTGRQTDTEELLLLFFVVSYWEIPSQTCIMAITTKSIFHNSLQRFLYCSNLLELKQSKQSSKIRCLWFIQACRLSAFGWTVSSSSSSASTKGSSSWCTLMSDGEIWCQCY